MKTKITVEFDCENEDADQLASDVRRWVAIKNQEHQQLNQTVFTNFHITGAKGENNG